MVGSTIGRYRILAKLGEGGMGSVWKAEDPLLGRSVALKFLADSLTSDRDARARFLREARAASTLEHPGIATVFDTGEADGKTYIAFQLVDGETVAAKVGRGGLSFSEAVRIALNAADALHHAHERGVLHRDVTSRNIMVAKDGRVIVVDFGLALPEGHTRVTQSGAAMGTAPYMAPEIALGENADRRSDVYGLGVVLYEMVAGRLPFKGERLQAVLYAAVHTPAQPPSTHREQIPAALDAITLKALSKSPGERHQSAREFASELRALARSGAVGPRADIALEEPSVPMSEIGTKSFRPAATSPERPASQTSSRAPRRSVTLVAGILGVSGLVILVLYMTGVMHRPRSTALSFASIAVLPLQNTSEDPNASRHLGYGIGEALTTKLTQLGTMRVTPWVTSQRYTDLTGPLPEVAKELNVDGLIVGSLQVAGGRIRGTVGLVDGKTGLQSWAQEFDEPSSEIFAVQKQIAVAAATALKGRLSGQEEEALARPPAASAEAYEFYLRGTSLIQAGDKASFDQALAMFERAVEIDPSLADAHVGIGSVHTDRYFRGYEGGRNNLVEAEARFREALRLQPGHTGAWRGLVHVFWLSGQTEEALKIGMEAAATGRDAVDTLMTRAEAYVLNGFPDTALPLFRKVIQQDPANEGAHWYLVIALQWAGRDEETIDAGEEYLQKFGDDAQVHMEIGMAYFSLGDLEPARVHLEKSQRLSGEGSDSEAEEFASYLYVALGEKEEASALARRMIQRLGARLAASPDSARLRSILALYYGVIGDRVAVKREVERLLVEAPTEANTVRLAAPLALLGDLDEALRLVRASSSRWTGEFQNVLQFGMRLSGAGFLVDDPRFKPFWDEARRDEARLRALY